MFEIHLPDGSHVAFYVKPSSIFLEPFWDDRKGDGFAIWTDEPGWIAFIHKDHWESFSASCAEHNIEIVEVND